MESAVILVGRNNTGKSVVMEALLAACGYFTIDYSHFNDAAYPIKVQLTLEIEEEDLWLLYQNRKVSKEPG